MELYTKYEKIYDFNNNNNNNYTLISTASTHNLQQYILPECVRSVDDEAIPGVEVTLSFLSKSLGIKYQGIKNNNNNNLQTLRHCTNLVLLLNPFFAVTKKEIIIIIQDL